MDLTPEQRTRAKELANLVADKLPPGGVASEFRVAGLEQSWRQYTPADRLLQAIHLIVEATQQAEADRIGHFEDMASG